MSASTDEMHQVAKEAAREALVDFFLTIGVDVTDPDDIIQLQRDFAHLRTMRNVASKVGMRAVMLTATAAIGAVILAVAAKFGYVQ